MGLVVDLGGPLGDLTRESTVFREVAFAESPADVLDFARVIPSQSPPKLFPPSTRIRKTFR